MTIQKIAAIAGIALFSSGLCVEALAQVQPQSQSAARNYSVAGTPSPQERRPPSVRPDGYRPPQPARSDYRSGSYRPPAAVAPLSRYRQPMVVVPSPIVVGSVLPYGYGSYPIDNWGYYNLPAPCCGQYWVQYGPNFLLVDPNGVVLQVLTP